MFTYQTETAKIFLLRMRSASEADSALKKSGIPIPAME
jgi:hypothetical protein